MVSLDMRWHMGLLAGEVIYLIIRKVFACGYTWDELEKYFGKSRKVLEEEIKEHYMSSGENAAEKNAKLIEVINRNSVVKQG